jgi:Sec61beta family
MSATGPSAAGLRKRTASSGGAGGGGGSGGGGGGRAPAGTQGSANGGFSVRLYNDAAPGFKVGPYFVVTTSVVYLVVVIVLHIWGRIGGKS